MRRHSVVNLRDPRLGFVHDQLLALMNLVDLRHDDRRVTVNGFGLRQWPDFQAKSPTALLAPLSGRCNCDCAFCYERDNPLPYAQSPYSISAGEVERSLRQCAATSGFPEYRALVKEPFLNPQALEILDRIRSAAGDRTISDIVTNGSLLTEEVVATLARLGPVLPTLSLNSADPQRRQELMRDRIPWGTRTAIEAPQLLRAYAVPYVGSIVAYPALPLEDIRRTVHYLARNDALMVRISLYSFTKYNRGPYSEAAVRTYCRRVVRLVRELRREVPVPIICHPSLSWEEPIVPALAGVVCSSPAQRAGLVAGDIVTEVNGRPVLSRAQLRGILRRHAEERPDSPLRLGVDRQGRELAAVLEPVAPADDYPYQPPDYPPSWLRASPGILWGGLVVIQDFHVSYFKELEEYVTGRAIDRPACLVSETMQRVVQTVLHRFPVTRAICDRLNLQFIEAPPSEFWGGTISLLDLGVVDDIVKVIRDLPQGRQPGGLLVPSSMFDRWGFDLAGRHFLDAFWSTGTPVHPFPVERIYV